MSQSENTIKEISTDNFVVFCANISTNDIIIISMLLDNKMYLQLYKEICKIMNTEDEDICSNIISQLVVQYNIQNDNFYNWLVDVKTHPINLSGGLEETNLKYLLSDGVLKILDKIKEFMSKELPLSKQESIDANLKQGAADRKIYKQKLLQDKVRQSRANTANTIKPV